MKTTGFVILILICCLYCYPQDTIHFNYDTGKNDFKENPDSIEFKTGKNYSIQVHGLNSSVFDCTIESKVYTLTSPTPDILKPFFLGISESGEVSVDRGYTSLLGPSVVNIEQIYKYAEKHFNNLQLLKEQSDSIYEHKCCKSDSAFVDSITKMVCDSFALGSIKYLKKRVIYSIGYITYAAELSKIDLTNNSGGDSIDTTKIEWYLRMNYLLNEIQAENYTRYAEFLNESQNPSFVTKSKPIKAEKDVVELTITIYDKYAADTVLLSVLPLYTYGKCSFNFTTGFFFNNLFEESYYFKSEDLERKYVSKISPGYDISFGAMGHLSYKCKNNLKLGIATGAAISPIDGNLRYLLGVSLIAGRKKQLGINAGAALAKLKFYAFEDYLLHDGTGAYVPVELNEIPSYEKLKPGYYIGLTYNLTSVKK